MGVSRSPAELSRKIGRLAVEYQSLPTTLVKESSQIVKTAIVGLLVPATGGDSRLSGVGKKGARVGVGYTIIGTGVDARSRVYATGPFQLVERDTKAGPRPHKRRRGRGKNRFIGPIRSGYHPGTQGKHPWQRGIIAAEPPVTLLFRNRATLPLKRVF